MRLVSPGPLRLFPGGCGGKGKDSAQGDKLK